MIYQLSIGAALLVIKSLVCALAAGENRKLQDLNSNNVMYSFGFVKLNSKLTLNLIMKWKSLGYMRLE